MMLAAAQQAFSDLSLSGSPSGSPTAPVAYHVVSMATTATPGESMNNSPVYSVLKTVLDELDPTELQRYDGEDAVGVHSKAGQRGGQLLRVKDDLINLQQLQEWFMEELTTSDEHTMSMKEIWRHFCFDNEVYCSLALFGNLVYRHVFTHSGYWASVTRVGETNNKKYNLRWIKNKPTTDDQIEDFFSLITEEKEKHERRVQDGIESPPIVVSASSSPTTALSASALASRKNKSAVKIQPEMLVSWWNTRLEPSNSADCTMKMREIWTRFLKDTNIHISLALFGELSVRYVMRSNPNFAGVVRTRGIHDKKYSLQWKAMNPPVVGVPLTAPPAASSPLPVHSAFSSSLYQQQQHSPSPPLHNNINNYNNATPSFFRHMHSSSPLMVIGSSNPPSAPVTAPNSAVNSNRGSHAGGLLPNTNGPSADANQNNGNNNANTISSTSSHSQQNNNNNNTTTSSSTFTATPLPAGTVSFA